MNYFELVPLYVAYKLKGEHLRKFRLELSTNPDLQEEVRIAKTIRTVILFARKYPDKFDAITDALLEEE